MKVYVKNMLCNCSKFFVKIELERLGLHCQSLEIGEVEITENISEEQLSVLDTALKPYGFELICDNNNTLVKKIKDAINDLIDNPELEAKVKFSTYVSNQLSYSYHFLNNLFKEEMGVPIEKHFVAKKIQRAAELLMLYKLNLTEIMYQLNYKSITQLTNQFKMITGLTPLRFKQIMQKSPVTVHRFRTIKPSSKFKNAPFIGLYK